jgi:hypothetical protein
MSEHDGLKAMEIDETRIRDHRIISARWFVGWLKREAGRIAGSGSALRFSPLRTQPRLVGYRGCSYERSLHTVAGEVNVQVPKLPRQTLETAIIRRYRRRESLVGEALDRDAPGGDFSPAGRGYNRGALGHPSESEHGVEPRTRRSTPRSRMAEPTN